MTDQPAIDRDALRAKANDLRLAASAKMGELWWTLALRGVLALLLGLAALIWPDESIAWLLRLAGVFLIIDGATVLFHQRETSDANAEAGSGILSLVIGLVLLILPYASAWTSFVLIGIWALITGANYLTTWWQAPEDAPERDATRTAGLIAAGAGLVLILWPGLGLMLTGWILALAAFAVAGALFFLASKFKGLGTKLSTPRPDA